MWNSFVIVEQPASLGGTQSSSLILQSSNFFLSFTICLKRLKSNILILSKLHNICLVLLRQRAVYLREFSNYGNCSPLCPLFDPPLSFTTGCRLKLRPELTDLLLYVAPYMDFELVPYLNSCRSLFKQCTMLSCSIV